MERHNDVRRLANPAGLRIVDAHITAVSLGSSTETPRGVPCEAYPVLEIDLQAGDEQYWDVIEFTPTEAGNYSSFTCAVLRADKGIGDVKKLLRDNPSGLTSVTRIGRPVTGMAVTVQVGRKSGRVLRWYCCDPDHYAYRNEQEILRAHQQQIEDASERADRAEAKATGKAGIDRAALITDYVREHPGQSRTKVADAIGGKRTSVFTTFKELLAAGTLELGDDGGLSVAE